MEQITLRLDAELLDALEEEAEGRGVSRSEHIRDTLESRNEHDENTDELRDRIADLERDLDRVRREKRLILEERDEKAELVEYVERERSAEQRWRQASLATKLKWTVFGAPGDEDGKP